MGQLAAARLAEEEEWHGWTVSEEGEERGDEGERGRREEGG